MAIKRGSKVEVSFSAASMTDMIFLLLLFLMIATTMIGPNNALKLLLPKSANQLKDKPYTTVSITEELQYYVELTPVPFSQLESALKAKLTDAEDPTVSLHCDKTVPVDEVVKVMNIAKDNHYKLILATTPN